MIFVFCFVMRNTFKKLDVYGKFQALPSDNQ